MGVHGVHPEVSRQATWDAALQQSRCWIMPPFSSRPPSLRFGSSLDASRSWKEVETKGEKKRESEAGERCHGVEDAWLRQAPASASSPSKKPKTAKTKAGSNRLTNSHCGFGPPRSQPRGRPQQLPLRRPLLLQRQTPGRTFLL